jgi:hypothetical protein
MGDQPIPGAPWYIFTTDAQASNRHRAYSGNQEKASSTTSTIARNENALVARLLEGKPSRAGPDRGRNGLVTSDGPPFLSTGGRADQDLAGLAAGEGSSVGP